MRSHSLFSPCELLIYSFSATVRLAFFFSLRTADVSPRSSPLERRSARRNICRSQANSFSPCIFDRKLVKPVVCSLRIQTSLHSGFSPSGTFRKPSLVARRKEMAVFAGLWSKVQISWDICTCYLYSIECD